MMHKKSIVTFFTGLLLTMAIGMMAVSDASGQYTVTVSAGGFDRMDTVVSFAFPDEVEPGTYPMQDESGNQVIVQVDGQNRGWFILEELSAGSSKTYQLSVNTDYSASQAGITYTFDSNTVAFQKGNRPVLSYYYKENDLPEELDDRYKRGGYIHPVYSPEGTVLTNHLDTEMHPHHYGIWSAWTNTGFQGRTPDFWNVQNNTARVDHADSLETVWEGPVFGGLKAKNHFVDLSGSAPIIALNEEWQVRIFNSSGGNGYHIFDLVITHTANTGQPLLLPEYHYGGLAFRGRSDWNTPGNLSFLTSKGYDRIDGNETRARWSLMEGQADNRQAGVAILGHPSNFRAPQPVRIHPDIPYFVYAPMQLGEFSIDPGSPYIMRYRIITYDGEGDISHLNRLWDDYAYPPAVTVGVE